MTEGTKTEIPSKTNSKEKRDANNKMWKRNNLYISDKEQCGKGS